MKSPVSFKYLALTPLGGRGGVQRFFMLSHNIPFEEELINPGDAWGVEKKRLIESNENPCGTVPVTLVKTESGDEDYILSQHIATCRYLARANKIDSGDAYKDYIQDLVADEYQAFRNAWVTNSFGATEEAKATYRSEVVPEQLTKFNALYNKFKTADPYLSVSAATGQPLWGDAAIFGILYDHLRTGHLTEDALAEYDSLAALYKSYSAIPAIASWIEEKNAKKE